MKRLKSIILPFALMLSVMLLPGCSMLGFGGDTKDLTVTDIVKSIDCISQCVDDASKSDEAWAEIGRQSQKKK